MVEVVEVVVEVEVVEADLEEVEADLEVVVGDLEADLGVAPVEGEASVSWVSYKNICVIST